MAMKMPSRSLKKECAGILESLKVTFSSDINVNVFKL